MRNAICRVVAFHPSLDPPSPTNRMASLSSQLASLVENLIPELVQPYHVEDVSTRRQREEKRSELIDYLKEVLNSCVL